MRTIKIYDVRHAKKDLNAGNKTPLQASIAKWTSLADALYEIEDEMGSSCGLCIAHEDCEDCPLKACSRQPNYKRSGREIRALRMTTKKFIEDLWRLEG